MRQLVPLQYQRHPNNGGGAPYTFSFQSEAAIKHRAHNPPKAEQKNGGRKSAAGKKTTTDGGGWRLHHARQYREDGRARDRFSGKHGEDGERGDGATAPSSISWRGIAIFARRVNGCGHKGVITIRRNGGLVAYRYEAQFSDCQPCARKPQCCPENQSQGRGLLRWEESAAVAVFREKMASVEAQAQYRRRGPVVEFCHAWIKSKLGLPHLRPAAMDPLEAARHRLRKLGKKRQINKSSVIPQTGSTKTHPPTPSMKTQQVSSQLHTEDGAPAKSEARTSATRYPHNLARTWADRPL